jgi:hypothetical protein
MTVRDGDRRQDPGQAALKGALAAVAGGMAMKAVWEAGQRALPEAERLPSPTRGAVDALAARRSVELSDAQRTAAAAALYTGSMAVWGAVYGVVHSRLRPPALLHGLLLGGLVYAANFPRFGALPRAGIVQPPGEQSARQAAVPLGAHAAFGLATAAAFEALR